MLILVLVLKDSLRTFFKSLSLSWSLGVRSLSLSWSLGVRSLSLSWSLNCGSGPTIVLILVLVVLSLSLFLVLARTCFHYSIIPIYSHIIVVSMHTISFNYTYYNYVFPAVILLCVYKYEVCGLAMFFCYNHGYYKAYNIYGYNTLLVFHLESSNENLK